MEATSNATSLPAAQSAAQRRRPPNYFFRTASSSGGGASPTPKIDQPIASDSIMRQVLYSFVVNCFVVLLLLGLVDLLCIPLLLAVLELTPTARMLKFLTAILTAFLFQAGFRGSFNFVLAIGAASLTLRIGHMHEGFVPCFLVFFVGFHSIGNTYFKPPDSSGSGLTSRRFW